MGENAKDGQDSVFSRHLPSSGRANRRQEIKLRVENLYLHGQVY